jgi:hypothetical protein
MMTHPMMHTMLMDRHEKPWRPADFPTPRPITSTPIDGARSSSWTLHTPGMGAEPIQPPTRVRGTARLPFYGAYRKVAKPPPDGTQAAEGLVDDLTPLAECAVRADP